MHTKHKTFFYFLSPDHFSRYKDADDMTIEDELKCLYNIYDQVSKPRDLVEQRALLEKENDYFTVCHRMFLFHQIMSRTQDDKLQDLKQELLNFLAERPLEDWMIFYLEVYLVKSGQGNQILGSLIEEELFQRHVCCIYNPSNTYAPLKKFKTGRSQASLQKHFRDLKINQVHFRKGTGAFQPILNAFETTLTPEAYSWMMSHLPATNEWVLEWYIFDRAQFATDVLQCYDNRFLKDNADDLTDEEVGWLFVLIVVSLINGKLKRWSDIYEILSRRISDFAVSKAY